MDAREIVEPPAKKRKQYAGHYEDDWKCVFNGVITPSKLDDHHSCGITKSFKCRRTKMTMIVKRCLAVEATNPVIARCKSGPFSVMIDESTDRNTDKRLAVLVWYFDNTSPRYARVQWGYGTGDIRLVRWRSKCPALVEKPGRVKRVVDHLAAPTTKLTLLFLGFILPVLMDFNKLYQADETKVGALLPEMDCLLRKLTVKFVPLCLIRGQQDPRTVEFTSLENQHTDDNIAIGMPARAYLAAEELDPTQTAKEVRAFYTAVIGKMLAKFPFDCEVLKDLVVMDLATQEDLKYAPLLRLAARFAPDVDQEALKDEFEDLQLMEDDSISFEVDGRPQRLDAIWGGVISQKTALGVTRFPTLGRVMTALLSLPHSNADCERAFTECRKSLCADPISAFLQCKIKFDVNCCEFDVTPAMLRGAKHATAEYEEHV
ncbi:hypothetical protein NP493_1878g00021 [Ridgeia piscesae]|uniref:HAT C-terminal dimerisation domain-containing protein n=1 Tax=Ridgeia piscesae TaxID=27915 RepID=A0AAD9JQN3_RIDPI|nr:hypothetical protein NP493_1878g00021 [Ridgeia piscesae]